MAKEDFLIGEAKDGKQQVNVIGSVGLTNNELRAVPLNILNAYDDKTGQYKFSDIDFTGNPIYVGYLGTGGEWYIMQLTVNTGQARYIKGDSDYATSWAGRAGLVYDLFNIIF